MKVWVLFHHFSEKLPEQKWEMLLNSMPENIRAKAGRFVHWEDAHAMVLGLRLLQLGVERMRGMPVDLAQIRTDDFGRPALPAGPEFNISHSGNLVACTLSEDGRLGIDLEKVSDLDLDDFVRFFTPEEMRSIRTASEPLQSFFHLWTIKEAVMKADGRGMSLPPQEIIIEGMKGLVNRKEWHLQKLKLMAGYIAHLASEFIPDPCLIEEIQTKDL